MSSRTVVLSPPHPPKVLDQPKHSHPNSKSLALFQTFLFPRQRFHMANHRRIHYLKHITSTQRLKSDVIEALKQRLKSDVTEALKQRLKKRYY